MGLFSKTTKKDTKSTQFGSEEKQLNPIEGMTTRQLLKYALEKIGCTYEEEDDQHVTTTYQGEFLRIYATDERSGITIYDLAWYGAPLYDINNISLMRRAINDYNVNAIPTIVYTMDKEQDQMTLHTKMDLIWGPWIPDIAQCLKTFMDFVLGSHMRFFRRMEEIRREEAGDTNA